MRPAAHNHFLKATFSLLLPLSWHTVHSRGRSTYNKSFLRKKKDLFYVAPKGLSYISGSQSVAPGPVSAPSFETLSDTQILGPYPDLANKKLWE